MIVTRHGDKLIVVSLMEGRAHNRTFTADLVDDWLDQMVASADTEGARH